MKKKVKPTSVRLDNDLLEELDQRCGKLGCSRNDFIKNSVEFMITNQSDFDFGDEEESEETPAKMKVSLLSGEELKPIVKEVTEVKKSIQNGTW